jgi:hypothetical protein
MNQVISRRVGMLAIAGCVVSFIVGCDWERAGEEDTWNDEYNARYSWVDFSGVYEDPDGGFIVKAYVAPTGTPGSTVTNRAGGSTGNIVEEVVGVGDDNLRTFGGRVDETPIIPNTFSLQAVLSTGDAETFTDDGSGVLVSSKLQNTYRGSVNYYTGVFSVQFDTPVKGSNDVVATYIPVGSGSSSNTVETVTITPEVPPPDPGSFRPIYTFAVFQKAYDLTFRDNYGDLYYGRIREVQTTGGGNNGTAQPGMASTITATFEVSGNGIVMSGILEADYTAAQQPTTATGLGQEAAAPRTGTLENRVIRGVWMERTGDTGDIVAVSRTPEQVVSSTSTNSP